MPIAGKSFLENVLGIETRFGKVTNLRAIAALLGVNVAYNLGADGASGWR